MKLDLSAITLGTSRAAAYIGLSSDRAIFLTLGQDGVLFVAQNAVAVRSGGFVYYLDAKYPGSVMKSINTLSRDLPLVRVSGEHFDFILGSTLTKAGLPLTRRDSKDPGLSHSAAEERS